MRLLALISSSSGLLQFFLNPTFGTLSDRFGRKPFLLIGPAWNTIGNALIAYTQSPSLFMVLRVVSALWLLRLCFRYS